MFDKAFMPQNNVASNAVRIRQYLGLTAMGNRSLLSVSLSNLMHRSCSVQRYSLAEPGIAMVPSN